MQPRAFIYGQTPSCTRCLADVPPLGVTTIIIAKSYVAIQANLDIVYMAATLGKIDSKPIIGTFEALAIFLLGGRQSQKVCLDRPQALCQESSQSCYRVLAFAQ